MNATTKPKEPFADCPAKPKAGTAEYHRWYRANNREKFRQYEETRRIRSTSGVMGKREITIQSWCGIQETADWCMISDLEIRAGLRFFWVTKRNYPRVPISDAEVLTMKPQNWKRPDAPKAEKIALAALIKKAIQDGIQAAFCNPLILK